MSRYKGNDDTCPHCGMKYRNLNTGLSYYDVFMLLKDYSKDSADWTYKRRNTVLGKWHEIKKQMWDYHVNEGCLMDPRNVEALAEVERVEQAFDEIGNAVGGDLSDVPF